MHAEGLSWTISLQYKLQVLITYLHTYLRIFLLEHGQSKSKSQLHYTKYSQVSSKLTFEADHNACDVTNKVPDR